MTKELVVVILVVASFALFIGIGIYFARRQRSLGTYFLAEKDVGLFVSGLAIASTYFSAWAFLGSQGFGYAGGYSNVLLTVATGYFPIYLTSFLLNGKKMRMLAETHNTVTVPDAIYARYRSEGARFMGAVSVLVCMTLYLCAQVVGLGVLMALIFKIPYEWGVIAGMGVLGTYTILGGIQGAIYSDVFQGVLMMGISIWLTLSGMFMTGAQAGSYEAMKALDPRLIDPMRGFAPGFMLSYAVGIYAGFIALPHTITRYYMVRNFSMLRWMPWMNGVLALVIMGAVASVWGVAYSYRTLEYAGDAARLARADDVMPVFMMRFQPALLAGIGYAGVFAAILSTSSGMINVNAAAIVKDIMMGNLKMTLRNEVLAARIASAAVIVIASALAIFFTGFISALGAAASAIAGMTLALAHSIGLNWRGASKEAAIITMIVGVLVGGGGQLLMMYKLITLPWATTPALWGVLITWPLFYIVSKLTRGANRENVPPDIAGIVDLPMLRWRLPVRRVA